MKYVQLYSLPNDDKPYSKITVWLTLI